MKRLCAAVAIFVAFTTPAAAQSSYAPKNDEPNPYLPGVAWGKLPDGRTWGATGGVDIAPDGTIWAYDRCGGNQNGCANSPLDSILHFDTSGKLLKAFGGGLFNFPHGLYVDRDGNVWVTDHGMNPPNGKGNTVTKFSPDGKALLVLGKAGVAGDGADLFNLPSDVVVAANGDIFVADGHAPGPAARIVKFDKTGTFLKAWGSRGAGDAELNGPHALAIDSRGRLFVGDRSNNRIQIFDQQGTLLASWKQFGRPSGIYIDRNDVLYVTDSESTDTQSPSGYGYNPGVERGIRIGSVTDGRVTAFIPDPNPVGLSSTSEGVAVDFDGNVYGAEVGPRGIKKYVKAPPSTMVVPASGGDIVITPIMHASVQLEHAGKVIQIDPAMGDYAKAKAADLVLVTDVHEDHLNAGRIAKLRKTGAPVVVPAEVRKQADPPLADPVTVIANGDTKTVAGIAIEAVPMYNLKNKVGDEPFHTKGRGNGYVVTLGGKRLYFAGDTECVPEIKALKNIDVAFLPMNVPFTMPPAEAADCAKAFKPKIAIPYHFQGSRTEEFTAALDGSGVDVRMLNWYPTVFRPEVVAMERPGTLVDIGGRKLHVNCTGRGAPTVILQSSGPSFAIDWLFVQPEIAKTNRVCSYDRAGVGWSDPGGRESVSASVADLHAALQAAGEKPRYVMVGAGLGAVSARAYDLRFPGEVAGFVMVDGAHEDGFIVPGPDGKPVPGWSLTAEQLRTSIERMIPNDAPPPPPMAQPRDDAPFDRLPPNVLTTRITFETRAARAMAWSSRAQLVETLDGERAELAKLHEATVANAQPLGGRPLVVLTPENGGNPESRALQTKLVALSSNAAQRVVAKSGSEIHLYEPQAVVAAIHDVVDAAAHGSKLPQR